MGNYGKAFKRFSFIIGTSSDFDSWDELLLYWQCGGGHRNASRYDFEIKQTIGMIDEEMVQMYGAGMAAHDGWCLDETDTIFGFVYTHEIDGFNYDEMKTTIAGLIAGASDMGAGQDRIVQMLHNLADYANKVQDWSEE
jgi:hypothetical protein